MNRIIHIGIALALASLVAAATVAAQAAARPDSSRFLSVRQASPVYGLASDRQALMEQVRDPLFGFVFTMVEHDSLGTWRADDLLDFAATAAVGRRQVVLVRIDDEQGACWAAVERFPDVPRFRFQFGRALEAAV